jgi:2-methylcitrate dehydratase PrpD
LRPEVLSPSRLPPIVALSLAQLLNRTRYSELPPKAIERAKMIIASTIASAAPGSRIDLARIVRELAKERGGKPEATVWYDGAKLPVDEVARINAMLSDASASDDSDLRNVARTGTTVVSTGLAIGERTGASGEDLLSAIVTGYEAAGRIGEALGNDRQAFHASVIVAFGGVVAAAKLLKLTDEQMAHTIGITATTMGGLAIGTNSWARVPGGATQHCVPSTQRWPRAEAIPSTKTCWKRPAVSLQSSAAGGSTQRN